MPRIEQKDVDELVPMHVDGYSEEWAESLRWQLAMSRMNQRRLVVENARLRDQEELAKALHEVVWAPGASFDRASEASHEYMQRCARLVLLRMLGETEPGLPSLVGSMQMMNDTLRIQSRTMQDHLKFHESEGRES